MNDRPAIGATIIWHRREMVVMAHGCASQDPACPFGDEAIAIKPVRPVAGRGDTLTRCVSFQRVDPVGVSEVAS